ncbi:tRNA lysidine(34) synthetase TilS [Azospirillum doebereinerae]|uniref:tRNA lysidine(34) synthetase TilS n=1 Tax=Azospirillum doebereinerae TaxID=92933 RepID=UPI001EE569C6|nr:tRNA lysidine(34) synthetase TilS [Azospirillum doebereinerae]MCG5241696.1 tRNA lysidine(34) synthetase TilS [Azospirillum doebereinerae]
MRDLTAGPVSDPEFARLMDRLGGFEPAPRVAVGVSGGGDSVALALLLHRWAAGQGGDVLTLTVDHGLRPESGEEAIAVGQSMAALGIPHRLLRWTGDKPAGGVQAAARTARHRLLAEACAEEGVLHLALAHHRDDQAETVLLRLARGSGIDGLAGMAAIRAEGEVRILRPLLGLPHERLLATCAAAGAAWIEDPSNHNPRYARARLRAARSLLEAEGLDAQRLAETARRAGRARAALEAATTTLLAEAAALYPEGWIRLDPAPLLAAPAEIALRALTRCLAVVGGGGHPARDEAVERLHAELAAGLEHGRTLAGCRVLRRRGAILIAREPEAAAEQRDALPGERIRWDRRFAVMPSARRESPVTVARLGAAGWDVLKASRPDMAGLDLHPAVRESLPGLWSEGRLEAVPTLGFDANGHIPMDAATFSPVLPLGRQAFQVVSCDDGII